MKIKYLSRHPDAKHVPLWKWIVIILLVVAMPLFFSFYRTAQLQQAIRQTPPLPEQTQKISTQKTLQ